METKQMILPHHKLTTDFTYTREFRKIGYMTVWLICIYHKKEIIGKRHLLRSKKSVIHFLISITLFCKQYERDPTSIGRIWKDGIKFG